MSFEKVKFSFLRSYNFCFSFSSWLLTCALKALGLLLVDGAPTVHNVYFVKYDVTVSFMAQILDTVTYFVSHVLVVDTLTYFDIFL